MIIVLTNVELNGAVFSIVAVLFQIITVNEVDLRQASHDDAARSLKSSGRQVRLTVQVRSFSSPHSLSFTLVCWLTMFGDISIQFSHPCVN